MELRRSGQEADKTELNSLHPVFLIGYFACEVGVRQTWPYLTFASTDEAAAPAEVRLYMDSAFTVRPSLHDTSTGDEDDVRLSLLRLAEVLNQTVEYVAVEADASLSVLFAGGATLRIAGQGAPWTTHDVWWFGQA